MQVEFIQQHMGKPSYVSMSHSPLFLHRKSINWYSITRKNVTLFFFFLSKKKKESLHLELSLQIGRSLLFDNFCMVDYVSAGNKLFNPNWCSV